MKRFPLTVFFVLAFLLPWSVWGTALAEQAGLLDWHVPQSLAFWVGLTLATYLAALLAGGWRAVLDLLIRLVRVRMPVSRYAAAMLFMPLLALAAFAIAMVAAQPPRWGADVTLAGLAPALLLNVFMWWITEETAWRGFVLPRLQRRFNPLVASAVLGIVWGLWHIPLFFIAGSFQSTIPFVGFLLSIVATSIIIGWLFNRSRGSVLIAALFHGFTDVAIAFSGVMSSGAWLFWVFVGLQILLALAVSRDLARQPGKV